MPSLYNINMLVVTVLTPKLLSTFFKSIVMIYIYSTSGPMWRGNQNDHDNINDIFNQITRAANVCFVPVSDTMAVKMK